MLKKYRIHSSSKLVKDETSTKFHVISDDYFGTIATILSLLKQQLKQNSTENYRTVSKTFKDLENDLLFLQKNYHIQPRDKNSIITHSKPKIKNKNNKPKGKLNSQ